MPRHDGADKDGNVDDDGNKRLQANNRSCCYCGEGVRCTYALPLRLCMLYMPTKQNCSKGGKTATNSVLLYAPRRVATHRPRRIVASDGNALFRLQCSPVFCSAGAPRVVRRSFNDGILLATRYKFTSAKPMKTAQLANHQLAQFTINLSSFSSLPRRHRPLLLPIYDGNRSVFALRGKLFPLCGPLLMFRA